MYENRVSRRARLRIVRVAAVPESWRIGNTRRRRCESSVILHSMLFEPFWGSFDFSLEREPLWPMQCICQSPTERRSSRGMAYRSGRSPTTFWGRPAGRRCGNAAAEMSRRFR